MILLQYVINITKNSTIYTTGPFCNMASTMQEMKKITNEKGNTDLYGNNIYFYDNENIFEKLTTIDNATYSHFKVNVGLTIDFVIIELKENSEKSEF